MAFLATGGGGPMTTAAEYIDSNAFPALFDADGDYPEQTAVDSSNTSSTPPSRSRSSSATALAYSATALPRLPRSVPVAPAPTPTGEGSRSRSSSGIGDAQLKGYAPIVAQENASPSFALDASSVAASATHPSSRSFSMRSVSDFFSSFGNELFSLDAAKMSATTSSSSSTPSATSTSSLPSARTTSSGPSLTDLPRAVSDGGSEVSTSDGSAYSITSFMGGALRGRTKAPPLKLRDRFARGLVTGALCLTTESEQGYWVCLVVDVVQSTRGMDALMQLAQLRVIPEHENQQGTVGSLYQVVSDETFWEQEARLVSLNLTAMTGDDGHELFKLMSDIHHMLRLSEEGTNNDDVSSIGDSLMGRARGATSSSNGLTIYQLDDPSNMTSPIVPIDLATYDDIATKCGELISNVTYECSLPDMTPAHLPSGGNPWKPLKIVDDIQVFKKSRPGESFHCYMARCVAAASPAEIKFLIKHSKNREKFDPFCKSATIVQTIDDATVVVRLLDRKFYIYRDFVVMRHCLTTSDGTVVIASNSVATPACPETEHIRARVIDSGFCLTPRGRGACTLQYILQLDLGGWLPEALVDWILDTQVVKVLERIRDHYSGRTPGATSPQPLSTMA